MTKLYNHAGEWQIPGKQDKKAERVDVPSSPPDLATWLNERHVSPEPTELEATPFDDMTAEEIAELRVDLITAPPREKIPGHCPECGRSAAGTLRLQLGNDIGELEAWLESRNAGDLWALQRAAELIRDRARAIGGSVDQGGRA